MACKCVKLFEYEMLLLTLNFRLSFSAQLINQSHGFDVMDMAQQQQLGEDQQTFAQTVTEQNQNLMLDQNAVVENGQIWTPEPSAMIKEGAAFLPQTTAVLDSASGKYMIDGVPLNDVIVNESGQVWAQAAQAKILLDQNGSQVVYTPDFTAQQSADGSIYTQTGTQNLPPTHVVQADEVLAQSGGLPGIPAGLPAVPEVPKVPDAS